MDTTLVTTIQFFRPSVTRNRMRGRKWKLLLCLATFSSKDTTRKQAKKAMFSSPLILSEFIEAVHFPLWAHVVRQSEIRQSRLVLRKQDARWTSNLIRKCHVHRVILGPSVVDAGFCDLISATLSSRKEDVREKVLHALHALLEYCKLDKLVPQLESLRSHYGVSGRRDLFIHFLLILLEFPWSGFDYLASLGSERFSWTYQVEGENFVRDSELLFTGPDVWRQSPKGGWILRVPLQADWWSCQTHNGRKSRTHRALMVNSCDW